MMSPPVDRVAGESEAQHSMQRTPSVNLGNGGGAASAGGGGHDARDQAETTGQARRLRYVP